jgi:hypothetical protein
MDLTSKLDPDDGSSEMEEDMLVEVILSLFEGCSATDFSLEALIDCCESST